MLPTRQHFAWLKPQVILFKILNVKLTFHYSHFSIVCSFAHLFTKLPYPGDSEETCSLRVKLPPVTTI